MPSIEIKDDNCVSVNSSCTIILKNKDINIEYNFDNSDFSVLIFNDYDGNVIINEKGNINSSNVKINYIELNNNKFEQLSTINVNKNSELEINTIYLGVNDKRIVFDLINKEADSKVEINNNIVCLDKAIFNLECIGKITKGAKRSVCHQKSHCLTIDSPKLAKVLPTLCIDENDVEASHSLSSGTIDEEILFYMNSRGLDKKHSLNLVLKSYLMPSDDYYDEFEMGKQIQEKAIKKVDEICSM